MQHADQDFQAARYDKAEIEYLRALRIPPASATAMTRLGLIYYEEGRLPQACAYLQKGTQMEPGNIQAQGKLARALLMLGGLKEAREAALQVLEREPGNEDGLLTLAGAAATSNLVSEAFRRLDSVPEAVKAGPSYHVARGELLARKGDLVEAEAELKRAIVLGPKSGESYAALGEFELMRGNVKGAMAQLRTAADLSPLRSPLRLSYAEVCRKSGDAALGEQTAEEMTKKTPDYVPAWVFLAQCAFAEKRYEECTLLINATLGRDPINLDALVLRGSVSLARGEPTNAVAQFERILSMGLYQNVPQVQYLLAEAQLQTGSASKAIQTLNEALGAHPGYAEATLLLANLKLRRGDATSAIILLKKLSQQQPQVAEAQLLLATAYLVQKDPDDAIGVYRRMEGLFPKSPQVPQLLGLVLFQQNDKAAARRAFEKSLEIAPDYLPALENIVDLDILDKRYDAARQRVRRQMQQNPLAAGPWLLMAKIAMAEAMGYNPADSASPGQKLHFSKDPAVRGEVDHAEAALLKAISLEPGLSTSYLLLARLYVASDRAQQALEHLNAFLSKTNDVAALMQLGMIQEQVKDYGPARAAYEKLLTINPRFSPALNNLAYLDSERFGELDKAYRMAEQARQLMPYDPSTADTLGWILYKRGEYERALGLIEEAAQRLAGDPEIQFHLGMAHYMMGEEELARVQLEAAAGSSKDFPGKAQAKGCLEVLAVDGRTAGAAVVEELEKRLREFPNDPVAASRLGASQARKGEWGAAAQTYKQVLDHNPGNPRLMIRLAQVELQLGRLSEALNLAKDAHALAPDDPQVSHVLGQLAFRDRDFSWAASLLQEAAAKLPRDSEVAYDLGWSYYSQGRVSEATSQMQKALQADPDFGQAGEARRFLALVSASPHAATGESLVSEARTILKQDPGDVPALALCAAVEASRSNYQASAELCERVLQEYPLFTPATRQLAMIRFVQGGKEAEAYDLAVKARRADPNDPAIAKLLGMLEYHRKNFARAAQLLEESANQSPDDAELLYYLGMSRCRLNELARGKAALQRALGLNLRAQLASEANQALRELK